MDITRGEFDLLKEIVTGNQARMESIDVHGTRGVAVIQEQVTELIKDLTELKVENTGWQAGHALEHKQDKRDRVSGRRWLIGIGFAGLASMAAVIGLLEQVLAHIH
jgi:hypothetical protein